jgi:hypothetical protein
MSDTSQPTPVNSGAPPALVAAPPAPVTASPVTASPVTAPPAPAGDSPSFMNKITSFFGPKNPDAKPWWKFGMGRSQKQRRQRGGDDMPALERMEDLPADSSEVMEDVPAESTGGRRRRTRKQRKQRKQGGRKRRSGKKSRRQTRRRQ